ncbi:phosphotransferase [Streptomyces sp. NPDC050636]|uniref:phosphotransferase family protein n=1 Tax=Streptomyces sp. NPDC050636 TaxID=3154510 RepID=UPI00341EB4E8
MITLSQAERLGDVLGLRLTRFSATPDGQGRTFFASTLDAEPVMLKWFGADEGPLPPALDYAETLRRRGYPTARTIAHGPVPWGHLPAVAGGGYVVVQEQLSGNPAWHGLTSSLLEEVLAAVEIQAGAASGTAPAPGRDGAALLTGVVRHDSRGWWRAARHSGEEIDELYTGLGVWVRAVPPPGPRHDLVHFDLGFSNILVDGDRLTGIVDLDQLTAGDRSVDLVSLAFHFERLHRLGGWLPAPDTVGRLTERALRISGRSWWRHAVAYYALFQLNCLWPPDKAVRLAATAGIVRRMMAHPD